MYEFNITLTEKDVADFNIFHMKHSKTMRKTMMSMRFLFPVVFLAMGFLVLDFDLIFWAIFLIGSILSFFLMPKVMEASIKRRVKLLLKDGKNGELFAPKNIVVDESGIKSESLNTTTFYKWGSVVKISEDESTYYIYVSSIQAVILPKKFIGSQSDLKIFGEFMNRNLLKNGSDIL